MRTILPSLTLDPSPGGRGKLKPFSRRDKGTLAAKQKGWDEGRVVTKIRSTH
jgi:hypothetical protein